MPTIGEELRERMTPLLRRLDPCRGSGFSTRSGNAENRSPGPLAKEDRAVVVAYPVAFDWSFLFWYFIRWCGDSPFGYSSCLDIRTLYQAKARTVHDCSGKQSMPAWLLPSTPHTHNALDDAREQAELFANVFEYVLDLRGPGTVSPQSVLQAGRS